MSKFTPPLKLGTLWISLTQVKGATAASTIDLSVTRPYEWSPHLNLPSWCHVSPLQQTSVRCLSSWSILWPTSDQWADTRLRDWADSWDKTPFIPRDLWLSPFLKKYMLQRHSSQTLVLRTEFGARANVTQSGLNQTLQHAWKPATIHLSASEHVAIKHMCVDPSMFWGVATPFSLRVDVHLLGGNDASCSLYHLYHSAQLYSFSFIHFPSYILKGMICK